MLKHEAGVARGMGDSVAVSRGRAARLGLRRTLGFAAGIALLTLSAGAYPASSINYTYDTLGRLNKVSYSDGVKTTTITYSYDAAGNRTSVVSASP